MKPFELFCFKHSKYFQALLFFLVARNKKFQRAIAQPYANAANANARRDEHGTPKYAHGSWILCSVSRVRVRVFSAPGFSVLYHVFARKQYAFSVLHYVMSADLHYSVTPIRDFFYPWDNRALLQRGFSLAIIIIIIIIIIIVIIIIIMNVFMSLFRKLFTP